MNRLLTLITFLFIASITFGQAPEKMSYQAVLRDSKNKLIVNKLVGMQISILKGATEVYRETQLPTTNNNGLVSLEIGAGSVVFGVFKDIDWGNGVFSIKTEIDPTGGNKHSISGTTQMLSVPYSMYAKTAENGISEEQSEAIKLNSEKYSKAYIDSIRIDFENKINALKKINEEQSKEIALNSERYSKAQKKKLEGKLVVSLGDSHMVAPWLSKFCELTGATYNNSLESSILANSFNYTDSGLMMGMSKALNQYCIDNTITPDVILIENVHFKRDGLITDYVPMIYDNLHIYPTTYSSLSALQSDFKVDKAAFIASLTPKIKTALRFNYSTFKHTITFTSTGALVAGTIQLTINGSVFPINVTAGQTLSQAITALNDWALNVSNWTNAATKGAARTNTIELVYTGNVNSPTSPTISFIDGGTGMSMTTNVLTTTVSRLDSYFNSLLLSDWNTSTKWIGTDGTSAYPAMMGLLEYLKDKFPLAEIVVWSPQQLSLANTPDNSNSFLVETFVGSGVYVRDYHKYKESTYVLQSANAQEAMRITAEYYDCRFIDVANNCGINIFNMFDGYYTPNDVHPLTRGYEKWGQTLAELY